MKMLHMACGKIQRNRFSNLNDRREEDRRVHERAEIEMVSGRGRYER